MKAIFTGSLADGFTLTEVVVDADGENIVVAHLANGLLAEALEIQDPASRDGKFERARAGQCLIIFGDSIGSGFEVFGPFDEDVADDFAETNRPEDGEWSLSHIPQPDFGNDPRLHVLVDGGYQVFLDPDGGWIWESKYSESDTNHKTGKQALDDAWRDAASNAMGADNLSSQDWDALSQAQQFDLIRAVCAD